MTKVYTVGYGGRKISDFANLLRDNGVQILVDVRRFPRSKNPDYTRDSLADSLPQIGIDYVYLGDKLGGFLKGGFEKHMDTTQFMDGFQNLLDLTEKGPVAIMCMERRSERCHRRFISRFLQDLNMEVRDI